MIGKLLIIPELKKNCASIPEKQVKIYYWLPFFSSHGLICYRVMSLNICIEVYPGFAYYDLKEESSYCHRWTVYYITVSFFTKLHKHVPRSDNAKTVLSTES